MTIAAVEVMDGGPWKLTLECGHFTYREVLGLTEVPGGDYHCPVHDGIPAADDTGRGGK